MSKISLEQFCTNLLKPEADNQELHVSKLFIYTSMDLFNVKYLRQTAVVVVLSWLSKGLSEASDCIMHVRVG